VKLWVVTPTLGDSAWLPETVESVARCAAGARHVLVTRADRVAELAARFPGAHVVAESGAGMYAAINAGLAGGGDWEAFTYINDDDVLLPGFARVRARVAAAGREAVMVYGGVRLIDVAGRRLGGIPISAIPGHNRALYAERLEPVYQHGTVITRAAWERVGGFDGGLRLCGDTDYLARVCLSGVTGIFVRGEVAAFRLRAGQLTQNRGAMEAERAAVDMKLGLRAGVGGGRRLCARIGFRAANLHLYAERVAKYGWKRFDTVIEESAQR
jgi:glycosyltransferase involved in cell wall biosynthesis